jgi:multisubunit Na+/H+ antiporter MnhC subunit
MNEFFGMVGVGIIVLVLVALVLLYITNVVRIVIAFKTEEYSILLVSRIIGVFFPVWGVIMGLVS